MNTLEPMGPQVLLEFEAPDRWVYVVFDESGEPYYVTKDEWESLFRPGPEDQS